MTLREIIAREIRQRGPIPFSRFMQLCLYQPELGYYSRGASQFGKAGDFYTSSDVHAVFGRLLARQFEEMWRVLGSPGKIEILELGPGRGLFAQDVLDWSAKKFPEFFAALHYSLCENSPALRSSLKETLKQQISAGTSTLCEVSSEETCFPRTLPADVPVIVFANEFFDALPVEVISDRGKLHVGEEDGGCVETWSPASADELEFLDRYGIHPEKGERVEAALAGQRSMAGIAASIERGLLCVIDYGYSRAELLEGRHRGTVAAYRQHSFSTNPYEAPGEQDITAHVNFTALASAAEREGMVVAPLVTQSQFLMGIGEANQFADAFEECRLLQERAKVALQLKHLISPEGMGETFHVLVASKGVDVRIGSRLSGLSFGKR